MFPWTVTSKSNMTTALCDVIIEADPNSTTMLLPVLLGLRLVYFGNLMELGISMMRTDSTFYVLPDDFFLNSTAGLKDARLDCSTSNLISTVGEAVYLPRGTNLKPACLQRQVLKRIAAFPATLEQRSLAEEALDSRAMPCSVLVPSANSSVESFDFECEHNGTFSSFWASTISVWPSHEAYPFVMYDVGADIYIGSEKWLNLTKFSITQLTKTSTVFIEQVHEMNVTGEAFTVEKLSPQPHDRYRLGPFLIDRLYRDCISDSKGDLALRVMLAISLVVIVGLLVFILHGDLAEKEVH